MSLIGDVELDLIYFNLAEYWHIKNDKLQMLLIIIILMFIMIILKEIL